ncbi:MAG: alkyl sulfatase dimerization domain-containing protein [Patescibacteria group bacterium]|nr:alkyl sulfatase dimerization domain-containing protein [Patescibacteria group bacterium]
MSIQKDATASTRLFNESFKDPAVLNWEDKKDFENAQKGFVASMEEPVIRNSEGKVVWDMTQYDFLSEEDAPASAHPSLWRNARLNMYHGLFKVTDNIYQVRGHDLSVISFIQTDNGYIVVDPLISSETAKASLDLLYKHVGEKPVVAVIYTHSHVDHFGGVKGVATQEDVDAGKIKVIASEGFMREAVSENVMAGNAMSRRASYMYGNLLPKSEKGGIDGGLGKSTSSGIISVIEPTDVIKKTGTIMNIDGVEIVFQFTPGTEAPTEMNFYFPQMKALCMAENCTHTLHNLYTLRGAQVRDAAAWSHYIDESIDLFGESAEIVFASHHWPTWGQDECIDFLKKQRDMYKYIHDETLRLANHGYTMIEIAEMMELPEELSKAWYNRGYYGSINHDTKAVYNKYLGFFDGNPATLHPLPPEQSALKHVEFMGGADVILEKARENFEKGEYRWVAQVVNYVVFADPDNEIARNLQADALEQLGYQSESAPWRNFYLSGAKELREGVLVMPTPGTASKDMLKAMGTDMIFDIFAISFNGIKAADKKWIFNFTFTDIEAQYSLVVENGVLHYYKDRPMENPNTSITMTREQLNNVMMKQVTIMSMAESGDITLDGDQDSLKEFFELFDEYELWFNIVTP